jgi:nucleotide-binding universal stress UspA family protein
MNLLLGLDGSELSMLALDHAIERASESDGTLTVAIYEGPAEVDLDDLESRAVERLTAAGLDVDVRRLQAAPGSKLVELAEHDYDQLVLGGGRISPMGKIRIGNVLEFVLANVQITVTLVR